MAAFAARMEPLASLFLDEKAASKFTCPICQEVKGELCMPVCQHTACRACWELVDSCPFCRGPARALAICRHLACSLAEARVRCPFSCGWSGEHQMLAGHEVECHILKFAAAQEELDARDEQVGELQRDIAKQNAKIFALKTGLARKNNEIHVLQGAVADAHARIDLVRACVCPAAEAMGARLPTTRPAGARKHPRRRLRILPAGTPLPGHVAGRPECRSRSRRRKAGER